MHAQQSCEEVEEIQKHSEFMQRNLEATGVTFMLLLETVDNALADPSNSLQAAIEAVSCQLSSVTAWVQQDCF